MDAERGAALDALVGDGRELGMLGASGGSTLHALVKARVESIPDGSLPEALQGGALKLEVSFVNNLTQVETYGTAGSVRLDAIFTIGTHTYVVDYKSGNATLTNARVDQIRSKVGNPSTLTLIEVR